MCIAAVSLNATALTDDGTADFICTGGDPDPTNNGWLRQPDAEFEKTVKAAFHELLWLDEAKARARAGEFARCGHKTKSNSVSVSPSPSNWHSRSTRM